MGINALQPRGALPADSTSPPSREAAQDAARLDIVMTLSIARRYQRSATRFALHMNAEQGQLFMSSTASLSVVKDYHGKRCLAIWNATAAAFRP